MIRKARYDGSFYSANPEILRNELKQYFNNLECEKKYDEILGIISPHAGYVYSGKCAAYGFKCLDKTDFERAVIIAPNHRISGFQFSVGNFSQYETPLGFVEVDKHIVEQLLNENGFVFEQQAHQIEHSLEVQLPFLQYIKPNIKIIPILFGSRNLDDSKYLAEILLKIFKEDFSKTKIITSSDLSHYHSAEFAKKIDGKLIENLQNFQIEKMIEQIQKRNIEACGIGGILTILHLAQMLKFDKIDILNYTHSGVMSGDNAQVVGYLSSLLYK